MLATAKQHHFVQLQEIRCITMVVVSPGGVFTHQVV